MKTNRIIKISIICIFLISLTIPLFAGTSVYLTATADFAFITNEFSSPLPQNGDRNWLEWKQEYPYYQRYDVGTSIDTDIFFSDSGRTGLSLDFRFGKSLWYRETVPTGDLNNDWEYTSTVYKDNLNMSISGAFGPIFRAQFGIADVGLGLRLSISDYLQDKSFILGIQVTPYAKVFVTDNLFISINGLFDYHPMKFIADESKKYEEDFNLLTSGVKIGCGYLFGNRGK